MTEIIIAGNVTQSFSDCKKREDLAEKKTTKQRKHAIRKEGVNRNVLIAKINKVQQEVRIRFQGHSDSDLQSLKAFSAF